MIYPLGWLFPEALERDDLDGRKLALRSGVPYCWFMIEVTDKMRDFLQSSERLIADCESWWIWRNKEPFELDRAFENIMRYPEFRSIVEYRLRDAGIRSPSAIMPKMRLANDLNICTPDIGGGFRVQHGHSTWVLAEKIGENFHVNQNVTIGDGSANGKRGRPTIGKNVRIFTGAVVVGPITIGDYVTIAPNSFVNFDVPAGKKVFPARSVII